MMKLSKKINGVSQEKSNERSNENENRSWPAEMKQVSPKTEFESPK